MKLDSCLASQLIQLVCITLISFNNSQSLKVINLNQLKRFRSQFTTFTIKLSQIQSVEQRDGLKFE